MDTLSIVLTSAAALAFGMLGTVTVLQYRRCLMMMQQNSYRADRYNRWISQSGDSTSFAFLGAYLIMFMMLAAVNPVLRIAVLAIAIVYALAQATKLAKAKYKKPLVMTGRARRLLTTQLTLALVIVAATAVVFALTEPLLTAYAAACATMAALCLSHPVMLAALWLMKPVEKHINDGFYNQARTRLQSMPDLKIVGITGSYGKTSTKHYLHRILSEHYDTLMTPGSYNTTLGVVRTVNEMLKPYNQVFIVEMGAKQRGDIREICDLVHPTVGIITAVGPQHLESFGTINAVRDTKFELADALPADGLAVVNNDFEAAADRPVTNTGCVRYGVSNTDGCQYTASDITYSPDGTKFTVNDPDGYRLEVETRLVGECNISNLMAAIIVAKRLGVPDQKIRYAVSRIDQVEHRLSIKRIPGGVTIIDDAFNSNPAGSRMALDVLAMMKQGTRMVITPGMIELGERQYELNKAFGQHMAQCVDRALIVGQYNMDAILSGLKEAGYPEENVLTFDTFLDANAWAMAHAKAGDTILIENDLPDTFK